MISYGKAADRITRVITSCTSPNHILMALKYCIMLEDEISPFTARVELKRLRRKLFLTQSHVITRSCK